MLATHYPLLATGLLQHLPPAGELFRDLLRAGHARAGALGQAALEIEHLRPVFPKAAVNLLHRFGGKLIERNGVFLRQADDRIREALALWLDREPDDLVITPQWPRDLVEIASEVSQARKAAAATAQKAGATTAKAAKKLDHMGLSRRDAADILGVSHQRVQQLLAG